MPSTPDEPRAGQGISDQFASSKEVVAKPDVHWSEIELVQKHRAKKTWRWRGFHPGAGGFVKGAKLEKEFNVELPKGAVGVRGRRRKKFVVEQARKTVKNCQSPFPDGYRAQGCPSRQKRSGDELRKNRKVLLETMKEHY